MTYKQADFEAIGTKWQIRIKSEMDERAWTKLLANINSRIEAFDRTYSRFRADSLVSQMARQAGDYKLPPDGYRLLNFYEKLYEATDGKVTPLIGQLLGEAGYDADYSFETKPLHKPPEWRSVIDYDHDRLTLRQPALLDFGAAGKGYLIDIVGALIDRAGAQSYFINAGGDIRHRSADATKLEVGLENPRDNSEAIGIARLGNQSLCASSGSKRQWGRFHHIIDPESLESPTQIISSWVIADNTMTADGLATALFFTPSSKLRQSFDFSFAILDTDMNLAYAKDFPATVFEAAA